MVDTNSELKEVIETEFKRIAGIEILPIYNIPTAVGHVMEAVLAWHQQLEAKTTRPPKRTIKEIGTYHDQHFSGWNISGKELDLSPHPFICGWHPSELTMIAELVEAKVAEAYIDGQKNILKRVSCCDVEPINGQDDLNVCNGGHVKLLYHLTPKDTLS